MKTSRLIAGILILFAVILSFYYDLQISLFFLSLRRVFLTKFLFGLNLISNIVIIFFFLTSLFLWKEHKRRWILPLWLSMFFSAALSFILKIIVARPRPFLTNSEITVLAIELKQSYLTWDTSFPSFHTLLVFSALPILDKEFPKFKYIWLTFASLVAIARVYFGVHYFSDVLVSAIIGYSLGMLMVKIEEKYSIGKELLKKLKIKN